MTSLKDEIEILKTLAEHDPIIEPLAAYMVTLYKNHYVAQDNKHFADGQDGFVDASGFKITVKDFLEALKTSEPPFVAVPLKEVSKTTIDFAAKKPTPKGVGNAKASS